MLPSSLFRERLLQSSPLSTKSCFCPCDNCVPLCSRILSHLASSLIQTWHCLWEKAKVTTTNWTTVYFSIHWRHVSWQNFAQSKNIPTAECLLLHSRTDPVGVAHNTTRRCRCRMFLVVRSTVDRVLQEQKVTKLMRWQKLKRGTSSKWRFQSTGIPPLNLPILQYFCLKIAKWRPHTHQSSVDKSWLGFRVRLPASCKYSLPVCPRKNRFTPGSSCTRTLERNIGVLSPCSFGHLKRRKVWMKHRVCQSVVTSRDGDICVARCSDITNTQVGISRETVPEGGNLPIYWSHSNHPIWWAVVLTAFYSWCVTPHSSPGKGCLQQQTILIFWIYLQ